MESSQHTAPILHDSPIDSEDIVLTDILRNDHNSTLVKKITNGSKEIFDNNFPAMTKRRYAALLSLKTISVLSGIGLFFLTCYGLGALMGADSSCVFENKTMCRFFSGFTPIFFMGIAAVVIAAIYSCIKYDYREWSTTERERILTAQRSYSEAV